MIELAPPTVILLVTDNVCAVRVEPDHVKLELSCSSPSVPIRTKRLGLRSSTFRLAILALPVTLRTSPESTAA